MANEILSPSAMPLGTSFRRNVNEPLDTSSVFPSLAIAETYAHNIAANENYCPYDGQIVVTLAGYPGVSESSPKITKQKGRLG